MTSQALMILIAVSLLKGALFGALFAWIFPPANRYMVRKMGAEASQPASVGMQPYFGLAILSGSGFALLDLIDRVSEASGLPGLLFWAVMALFGLSAVGTVLLVLAMPRQQPA
jgi:hypothetical protein